VVHTRPPSADPAGPTERDGAYSVRSVPVRLYLPDGPVLQDLVPPLLEDGEMSSWTVSQYHSAYFCVQGSPHTLHHYLATHIPLLFPAHTPITSDIAYALIQGVLVPPEAEMAWLGACLAGADGWVSICVGITRISTGAPGR
jgi:autophagy-related protein 5